MRKPCRWRCREDNDGNVCWMEWATPNLNRKTILWTPEDSFVLIRTKHFRAIDPASMQPGRCRYDVYTGGLVFMFITVAS